MTIAILLLALAGVFAPAAFAAEAHPYTGVSFGPDGVGGTESFEDVGSLAVDPANGDVYVYDVGAGKIYKFDSAGAPVDFTATGSSAISGVGSGGSAAEYEVALAPVGSPAGTAGDIYVANNGEAVHIYSPAGTELGEIGLGAETCGVATDSSGNFYAGIYSSTVKKFTPTANPPIATDQSGVGTVSHAICNVAADGLGNVYAANFSGEQGLYKLEGIDDETPTQVDPTARTMGVAPGSNDLYADRGDVVFQYDSAGNALGSFGEGEISASRGVAINSGATKVYVGSHQKVKVFGAVTTLPDVTTEAATGISKAGVTLHGTISAAGGPAATCAFQYIPANQFFSQGFDGALEAPCSPAGPFEGGSGTPVSATVVGLNPEAEYFFRLVGSSEKGDLGGQRLGFTTPAAVNVATGDATALTTASATLNGTVNPEGVELEECFFEYDETFALEKKVACAETPATIGSGNSPVAVHANLTGLDSATEYHFRFGAKNEFGTNFGAVAEFKTLGAGVEHVSVAGVTTDSATFEAEVNPNGEETSYSFEYVNDADFNASGFAEAIAIPGGGEAIGSGTAGVEVEQEATGLTPGTTYHMRLTASSASGVVTSQEIVFSTFETFVADTDCANQELRGGSSAGLPDCRAYEMVSPPQKIGQVFPPEPEEAVGSSCKIEECLPGGIGIKAPMQSSPDGQRVVFQGNPFTGGLAATPNEYLSVRGAAGNWLSNSLMPPAFGSGENQGFMTFSPDLSRAVVYQTQKALSPAAPAEGDQAYPDLYLWQEGDLQPLLTEAPPQRSAGRINKFVLAYAGANSGDASSQPLSHVIFGANDALTDEVPGVAPPAPEISEAEGERRCYFTDAGCNLYEWFDGQLRLVNVLPGNSAAAPRAVFGSKLSEQEMPDVDHAISADGSRIFWSDDTGQVFVRIDGSETKKVNDPAPYLTASEDGSKVLLRDGCLYDLQAESCQDLTSGNGGFQGILGGSSDLSRIYFVGTEALTPSSEENANGEHSETGEFNLYSWNEGAISFIGVLLEKDNGESGGGANFGNKKGAWTFARVRRTAQVSPNGRFLAFMSSASPTGYDNKMPSGTCVRHNEEPLCTEVFEYDAVADKLVCVSCNPSGEPPTGASNLSLVKQEPTAALFFPPHNLTTDGSGRLFFESQNVLSPRDLNGHIQDVYEWEPDGVGGCERAKGCVSLISSGHSTVDSMFLNSTPSGDDAFFITREQLLPRDKDEKLDLYNASVGGGTRELPAASCSGEACKGPGSSLPPLQSPGTASFNGPGNVKEKSQGHRKKKRLKHKHRHKRSHSAKHNTGGSK